MVSFKPYYNWNTFNTYTTYIIYQKDLEVLNLIITGIPSILNNLTNQELVVLGFKPYYNWNTFNT